MERAKVLEFVVPVRNPLLEEAHKEEDLPEFEEIVRDLLSGRHDDLPLGVSEVGAHVSGALRTSPLSSVPSTVPSPSLSPFHLLLVSSSAQK